MQLLKLISYLSLAFALTFSISCEDEQTRQMTEELISAFKSDCNSYGEWSNRADNHSNQLIQIFKNLKSSRTCSGEELGSNFAQLQSLAMEIRKLTAEPEYAGYRKTQEELQELMIVGKNQGNSEELQAAINYQIVTRQVELATLRGQESARGDIDSKVGYQDKFSRHSEDLSGMFNNLFIQTETLSSCLSTSPAARVQLMTSALAIAGSFVSPVIGVGMFALSGALTTAVEYIDTRKIDEALKDFELTKSSTALGCTMESYTNFYCRAQDAVELIAFKDAHRTPPQDVSELWRGLKIINEDLPVLTDWLLKVKAGSPPDRESDSNEKGNVLEKSHILEKKSIWVESVFNQTERRLDSSPAQRVDLLSSMVADFANGIFTYVSHMPTPNDPFYSYKTQEYQFACFLMKGPLDNIDDCGYDTISNEDMKTYAQRVLLSDLDFDITIARRNWRSIYAVVKSKVDIEFDEYIFENPMNLIAQADVETEDMSPKQVLQQIKEYLEAIKSRAEEHRSSLIPIINTSHREVSQVLEIIETYTDYYEHRDECLHGDDSVRNSDDCVELDNPLRLIYAVFNLRRGEKYFNDNLFMIVNWDIRYRLDNGEIPDDIVDIIRDRFGELNRRFVDGGAIESYRLIADLNKARNISKETLTTFTGFTKDSMGEVIERLHQYAVDSGEDGDPYNSPYMDELGKVCVMYYASRSQWPSEKAKEICMQSRVLSPQANIYPHLRIDIGGLDEKYSSIEGTKKKEQAKRCVYYNFLRANRLIQIVEPSEPEGVGFTSIDELLSETY